MDLLLSHDFSAKTQLFHKTVKRLNPDYTFSVGFSDGSSSCEEYDTFIINKEKKVEMEEENQEDEEEDEEDDDIIISQPVIYYKK